MAEKPQTLIQLNYYSDVITVAQSASSLARTRLFDRPAGSTGDLNDLPKQGILPDDRQGHIMGAMVRVHPARTSITSASAQVQEANDIMELIENLWITLYVNNRELSRGPIAHFPHPPTWHVHSFHEATDTDIGSYLTQNGGYMLFWQNIFVQPQQRIRVELHSKRAFNTLSQATDVEVTLQCLTEQLL